MVYILITPFVIFLIIGLINLMPPVGIAEIVGVVGLALIEGLVVSAVLYLVISLYKKKKAIKK